MGDISDYYLSQEDPFDPLDTYWNSPEPEGEHPPMPRRPQPTKTTWVTSNGQRIAIVDMTDAHLLNTIRYIRRTAPLQFIRSLEAIGMSDAAEMALDTEFEDMEDDDYAALQCPAFSTMLDEANKRGLTTNQPEQAG